MSELVIERHGHVEVWRIDRPHRANSLDPALIADLGAAQARAAADPDVRVVVLTGTGEKVFCAGMDLKAFAESGGHGGGRAGADDDGTSDDAGDRSAMSPFMDLLYGRFPKPLIAAVNGAAVGGGFELVLGCDMVVAAETARFGLPEVARGLIPGGGGTEVARRIPLAIALEMGMTGDPVTAARALELGLVNEVVPGDQVVPAALALAERVSRCAPIAVAAVKRLMRDSSGRPDGAAISAAVGEVFATEDAQEGARAFAERRDPNWKGR